MASFEEAVKITFHGVEYVLTLNSQGSESLTVELEQDDNNMRWRGDFTAKYIEDLTRRTGNFKKFGTFVRMLLTALTQDSNAVYIDLFTKADLEMLRNRDAKQQSRGGAGGGAGASMLSAGTAVRDNNRRYLVLTYVVEFDRVCFPLRLSYQDVPSAGALMRTVRRLKQERAQLLDKLADAKAHSAAEATASARRSAAEGGSSVEMMTLLQENDELRSQVARLSKAAARRELSGRGGPSKHEFEELQQRLEVEMSMRRSAERDYERLKGTTSGEIKRLRDQLHDAQAALEEVGDGAGAGTAGISRESVYNLKRTNKVLTQKCEELTRQLAVLRARSRTSGGGRSGDRPPSPRYGRTSPRGAAGTSRQPRTTTRRRSRSPATKTGSAQRRTRTRTRTRTQSGARARSRSPGARSTGSYSSASSVMSARSSGSRGSRASHGSRGSSYRGQRRRRGSTSSRRSADKEAGGSTTPRFDPTAWAKAHKAKLKAASDARNGKRTPTTPRQRRSGRGSSAGSRASSRSPRGAKRSGQGVGRTGSRSGRSTPRSVGGSPASATRGGAKRSAVPPPLPPSGRSGAGSGTRRNHASSGSRRSNGGGGHQRRESDSVAKRQAGGADAAVAADGLMDDVVPPLDEDIDRRLSAVESRLQRALVNSPGRGRGSGSKR